MINALRHDNLTDLGLNSLNRGRPILSGLYVTSGVVLGIGRSLVGI